MIVLGSNNDRNKCVISLCLNVNSNSDAVTSDGESFRTITSDKKGAATDSRMSDSRNEQTVGD